MDSNVTNARAEKVWLPAITQGKSRLVPKTSPQAATNIRSITKLVTSCIEDTVKAVVLREIAIISSLISFARLLMETVITIVAREITVMAVQCR